MAAIKLCLNGASVQSPIINIRDTDLSCLMISESLGLRTLGRLGFPNVSTDAQ